METEKPVINVNLKFVRVIERRPDGFVEFEFAIGEPELCAEMLLPADAFASFCSSNEVVFLAPRDTSAASDWNWSLHQATHQRFR
ncbi:phenol hydroxylase subunit [Azoarcus sp. L1K30]|uniref:phenol hydroxylase subunit n=1 Tax=Azoarcus sp. L1K30 TaxID=2820277 RepID=UPI001B82D0D0|nr:phenol hydroxylase subunit [Azoarcus sp. L1K30]MBR0565376.1 phenol hydroxylase subunit [Azoarcus sp. L1K30]